VSVLLDSSALLARLPDEPGGDLVTEAIASDAARSGVNLAEVMTILVRDGLSPADAERAPAKLPFTIHAWAEAGPLVGVTVKLIR